MHAVRVAQSLGQVKYMPSEFEKCVMHYCVRNLIQDLWNFSSPRISQFVDSNARFDLEKALASGNYGVLSDDIRQNLDVGTKMIYGITSKSYDDWVANLEYRSKLDNEQDKIPLMYKVYRLHSGLHP